jgi:RNA polymerase sigma-70 factor, ECF subfamily
VFLNRPGRFVADARIAGERVELVTCNSAPALMVYSGDRLDLVITVEIVGGKITNFYAIRNPDKLVAAATARAISR